MKEPKKELVLALPACLVALTALLCAVYVSVNGDKVLTYTHESHIAIYYVVYVYP